MKRIAFLIALIAIMSTAFFLNAGRKSDVTVLNARAIPMAGQKNNFLVTFEVQNQGPAKTLLDVRSASADHIHVMNPGYENAAIVIPGNGSGFFAMDGAHVMLMGADADFVQGAFIPVTLIFEDYGDVTTRALNVSDATDMHNMDHDISQGIESENGPSISLIASDDINTDGGEISVDVENFIFTRVPDDAPHEPHEGHAHLYLNGLKLGRLYKADFSLGPIPSGSYDLTVTLNSNTHQPYVLNGSPIRSSFPFEVSE